MDDANHEAPSHTELKLIASAACFLTYYVLAQDGIVTSSVGSNPTCTAWDDAQGNDCYYLDCPASPDSYSNYHECDGHPITALLGRVQLCENPARNINVAIHCNATPSPGAISYGWVGEDNVEHTEISSMICPHSCKKCAIYPNGYNMSKWV